MFDYLDRLDRAAFFVLNGKLTSPAMDAVMPFLTKQEHWYPVLIGLWVAMLIWGGRRGRIAAALLVVAVAASDQISCAVLKPLVGRLRPCAALPASEVRLLVGASKAFSFPSAHAANSFAMASVVSWGVPRASVFAFAAAAIVAYSRVYVGLHYPLDVVGGAVLGLLIGWILTSIGSSIERRLRRSSLEGAGIQRPRD
jgi:undecaprenyl-diphosphatase